MCVPARAARLHRVEFVRPKCAPPCLHAVFIVKIDGDRGGLGCFWEAKEGADDVCKKAGAASHGPCALPSARGGVVVQGADLWWQHVEGVA